MQNHREDRALGSLDQEGRDGGLGPPPSAFLHEQPLRRERVEQHLERAPVGAGLRRDLVESERLGREKREQVQLGARQEDPALHEVPGESEKRVRRVRGHFRGTRKVYRGARLPVPA